MNKPRPPATLAPSAHPHSRPPSPPDATRRRLIVVGVVTHEKSVLISQRLPSSPLPGYWEFPGGKVEPGELPRDALRREFREELGIDIEPTTPLSPIDHDYAHGPIRLLPMLCRHVAGQPRPLAVTTWRWAAVGELDQYAFPPANASLLVELRQAFAQK